MRVSADIDSPFNLGRLGLDPGSIRVLLDGVGQTARVEAYEGENGEPGWIDRLKKNPDGSYAVNDTKDGPLIERVCGAVVISADPFTAPATTIDRATTTHLYSVHRWPTCGLCNQSMTGSYLGQPGCLRCLRGRSLSADRW